MRNNRSIVLTHFIAAIEALFGAALLTSCSNAALPGTQENARLQDRPRHHQVTEFPIPTARSGPTYIVAGPDGNLWFTETDANKIGRITKKGRICEFSVPTPGSGPSGITVGPDGNLWFTESSASKIGKISRFGSITEFSLPPSRAPQSIAAGSDGNLWFTEFTIPASIGKIATTGASFTEFPFSDHGEPFDIAAGPDGNLWFTQTIANIGRITTSGSISQFAIPSCCPLTGANRGDGITTGPDGNLWFTEINGNNIDRITTTGFVTQFPIPTANSNPFGITAGPDGNLWFTEINKIGSISTTGVINEFVLPANSGPVYITTGFDGNLWFTDSGTNSIGRFRI